MSSVNMNIRIQDDVKEQAKQVLNEYGLDMTTAVNLFFRKVIAIHGLPFDLRPDVPNAETRAAMEEARNIIAHPEKHKKYNSFAEYVADHGTDV